MKSRFPIVMPDERLTRAREIMRDAGVRMIPVVESELSMKLVGVLYRLDLLNISSTRTDIRVREVANEPPVSLSPQENIIDASKKMLAVGEWYAPVLMDNKVIGVFGLENLIAFLLRTNPEILEVPVDDNFTRDLVYVREDDDIRRVWYLMLKHKYAGFPVVKNDRRLIGVVTQYDLLKHGFARIQLESESKPRRVKVREVMNTPAVGVSSSDTLRTVAEIMIKRNIGRVFVVDGKNRAIGVIDREDIARFIFRRKFS
jgi:CBS domain-containing protein